MKKLKKFKLFEEKTLFNKIDDDNNDQSERDYWQMIEEESAIAGFDSSEDYMKRLVEMGIINDSEYLYWENKK